MKRALVILALVLAGCGSNVTVHEPGVQVSGSPEAAPTPGAPVPDGAVRIAVVTHGPASSKFWAIIRNGVDAAARRLDVLVDYRSPDVFSVQRMSALIDQAVATKPDGLVVSIPSAGLAPAIERAVAAGIPVISINSGSDDFRKFGVLAHVGQVESRAGLEAGRRLAAAGVRNALCLNQERDNVGTSARCAGLAKAMREAGGRARTVPIEDDDPDLPQIIARVVAADHADGVLATNAVGGLAAAEGLAGANVKVGTFDLGPDVIKAVQAGRIGFAVDQQPYLQGYLPIEMLALRARYGILPAQRDVVATGPNFVTRGNAAQALALSERLIR
jgi:simple sugar transport system substrate-binding protein